MTENTSPQARELEREARRLNRVRLLSAVPNTEPAVRLPIPAEEDEPEPQEAA
jgi:hypothetical protein